MTLKDITNNKYGYLTAVKYLKSRDGNGAIWECICDCGKTCEVRSHSLLRGKTKSCGCKTGEMTSLALSKDFGVSNITQLYNTYKNGAKLHNYKFELTLENFSQITKENCYYCGIGPKQEIIVQNVTGDRVLLYNGIDRLDNTKGYIIGNIVAACGTCNIAKRDLLFDDFVKWISRVSKHLSERKIIIYGE